MKTKDLTDKQIQEQINALEEENANTQRLSFRRGHGWGDGVLEKRRDKINHLLSILAMRKSDKRKTPKKQPSAKVLTDKQIENKIAELEEENRNTQRLSMGRGHGWGDDAMVRRRDKINRLESIQLMRRLDKREATPKKEGLSRTWDSKTKHWVYHYTKRTKKAKKQPDRKLSQREEWLLTGEYKVRGKPKDVRKLGKVVTKGLNKTKKQTNAKAKSKRKKRTKAKPHQRTLFGGL